MGIHNYITSTLRNTSAGAIEGAVGLVDLASQGGAYLYNKATGRNIQPLQYGPMVSDALDLNPNRDSAAYIGGSLVGGALTGGAGAIRSGLQAGAKEGAKAAGTSLAAEAAGYAGSVGAARAAEAAGYGETGQMVAGLAGGIAAGARVPGAGAPVKQDIFGGTGAYNPDSDALRQAVRLEKEGKNAGDIWNQTGWFRGKDGNWRFEIDDSQAKFDLNIRHGDMGTVDEIMDHPALFDQYPELKRMRYKTTDPGEALVSGYYHPKENYIALNPFHDHQDETLLHELQHVIQDSEGHSPGGNYDIAKGYLDDSFFAQLDADFPSDVRDRVGVDGYLREQLKPVYTAHTILKMNNITQPKQLYNSSLWYEHNDEVRRIVGPPPPRGKAQLDYAQRAGRVIADLEIQRLRNSDLIDDRYLFMAVEPYLENGLGLDALEEVRKKQKSLERQRWRNREKGKLYEYNVLRNQAERLREQPEGVLYRLLEGEAEAFNVMDRMRMSADERRASYPPSTMKDRGQSIYEDVIPGGPGIRRRQETDGGVSLLFDPDEK